MAKKAEELGLDVGEAKLEAAPLEVERKSVTLECLNETLRSLNETVLRLSQYEHLPAGTIPNLTQNIDMICSTINTIAFIDALGRSNFSGQFRLDENGPIATGLKNLGIRVIRL